MSMFAVLAMLMVSATAIPTTTAQDPTVPPPVSKQSKHRHKAHKAKVSDTTEKLIAGPTYGPGQNPFSDQCDHCAWLNSFAACSPEDNQHVQQCGHCSWLNDWNACEGHDTAAVPSNTLTAQCNHCAWLNSWTNCSPGKYAPEHQAQCSHCQWLKGWNACAIVANTTSLHNDYIDGGNATKDYSSDELTDPEPDGYDPLPTPEALGTVLNYPSVDADNATRSYSSDELTDPEPDGYDPLPTPEARMRRTAGWP